MNLPVPYNKSRNTNNHFCKMKNTSFITKYIKANLIKLKITCTGNKNHRSRRVILITKIFELNHYTKKVNKSHPVSLEIRTYQIFFCNWYCGKITGDGARRPADSQDIASPPRWGQVHVLDERYHFLHALLIADQWNRTHRH